MSNGMILYHFTSRFLLPRILEDGKLKTTESNVSPHRPNAGPPVVWLTNEGRWKKHSWHIGSAVNKLEFKLTVMIPHGQFKSWWDFAVEHKIDAAWMLELEGENGDGRKWFVVERPVPREEWISIVHVPTGRRLWHPGADEERTTN